MKSKLCLIAVGVLVSACATNSSPPAAGGSTPAAKSAAPAGETPRIVRSRDGTYDGEVVGTPVPGSLFEKVQIGMSADEVNKIMGRTPARSHTYETGKRWIPFYYGNDAIRMQVLFEGEGCLIYATGNRFNLTSPDLIRIEHDPSGKCYQP